MTRAGRPDLIPARTPRAERVAAQEKAKQERLDRETNTLMSAARLAKASGETWSERTKEQMASVMKAAPDLEHLKKENAQPAIPDHVAAGMVTAIGFQGRDYKHQPLSAGETRALDDIARRAPVHAAAVESLKQRSANEQKRVPAGQSTGGRWTK